jgi:hypothetical protein
VSWKDTIVAQLCLFSSSESVGSNPGKKELLRALKPEVSVDKPLEFLTKDCAAVYS